MSKTNASDPQGMGEAKPAKLLKRDWILLPFAGILAVALLGFSSEVLARFLFPASSQGFSDCFVKDDPSGDAPAKPNSVCSERIVESGYTAEYKFNSRGNRAGMELRPKTPGTYRIVMIGSSFAMGLFVPREKTFAALLPAALSQRTGRKVELYNEATGGKFRGGPFPAAGAPMQINEALSASPDLILWIVTSNDFLTASPDETATSGGLENAHAPDERPASVLDRDKLTANVDALMEKLRNRFDQARAALMLKHFLLKDETQDKYVASYLQNEDDAGFLKSKPGAKWERLEQSFAREAVAYEAQAKAAGVPLVAVFIPNRAQTAMISMTKRPEGYDPYRLDQELGGIVTSHGGTYLDILPDYRTIPNPEQNYFPVDGHPDANGHAVIAQFLAKELTHGAVPALTANSERQNNVAQGK
jgi:hypothetical protein